MTAQSIDGLRREADVAHYRNAGAHDLLDRLRAAHTALDLDRLCATLADETTRVVQRLFKRDAVAQEGHVADYKRPTRPTHNCLRVMKHLVQRPAHGLVVPEHDHAERVPAQDHRHADVVDDPCRGVVVRRNHRDAFAIRVHPCDVGDGDAPNGFAVATGSGLGRCAHVAANSAPARRFSARTAAIRSHSLSATWRLLMSGHCSSWPPGTTSVTRLVSVPNPDPSSATSLATRRSTPLRIAFSLARSRDPVLTAKPTITGARPPSRATLTASARMSLVGSSTRVRPLPSRAIFVSADTRGRKSATAAAITSTSAVPTASRTASRIWAAVCVCRSLAASGSGTDVMPWMTVTSAPRSRAASAIATPIFPVERFPM